jgi:colanic acid biosynthesis protein WcaH
MLLNPDDFHSVVRLAPLVSIDLIIRNARGEVLLGLRNNEPRRDCFSCPAASYGSKSASMRPLRGYSRERPITTRRLRTRGSSAFMRHFYDANSFGDENFGTHYVVLAHELKLADASALKSDAQHSEMRWWDERDLLASDQVHENTKAYFR